MEKYARWDDPANLVNPFAPLSAFPPASLKYLTGPVLLLLRLPFLLLAALLLLLGAGLAGGLAAVPGARPLARAAHRLLQAPAARLLLLVIGYWSVPAAYAPANKLRLRKVKASAGGKRGTTRPLPVGSCVQAGDVVVCNATSPVQVLWLTWAFGPSFAHVVDTTPAKTKAMDKADQSESVEHETAGVRCTGMLGALGVFAAMDGVRTPRAPGTTTLRTAADAGAGFGGHPVCVFPEGVRSNGRGILMFHPVFSGFGFDEHRVHLVSFNHDQHPSSKFSATLPVGSALKSLLWHCMHASHSMRVTMLPARELVAPPAVESEAAMRARQEAQVRKEVAARANKGAYGGGIQPPMAMPDAGTLGNRCRDLLAKMAGVETLTRCSKDYDSFVEFWKDEELQQKKRR